MDAKLRRAGIANCFISEVTVAELKFGIENADGHLLRQKNLRKVEDFLLYAQVLPIAPTFDIYAKEKSRLRKLDTPIDDFDLLIGATALANDLVMVTNNVKYLGRMNGITIEDWTT